MIVDLSLENYLLLQQRFPEIAFSLSLSEQIYPIAPLDAIDIANSEKEAKCWRESFCFDEIEVLYVYGLGLGHYFLMARDWLEKQAGRTLVFIEKDLHAVKQFLASPCALDLLSHPQVHIRTLLQQDGWERVAQELSEQFLAQSVEVIATARYQKEAAFFRKLRLHLLRRSGTIFAIFSEVLYSNRLHQNVLANFKRLPRSFAAQELKGKFSGVPAIICGAGPSLSAQIQQLKQLENQALILAGGSAISALTSQGVQPHLAMALDPNPEQFAHLESSRYFEGPFLYANRLNPSVFDLVNGPYGYLHTGTGGMAEQWLQEKLQIDWPATGQDLGEEAFSVTTLALSFAVEMGCSPIILVGVDLCYLNGKRYAKGVGGAEVEQKREALDQLLTRKNVQGKQTSTQVKWVMEADVIGAFAKKHAQLATFINASPSGLAIANLKNLSLTEIKREFLKKSYDLRGKVHAAIAQSYLFSDLERPIADIYKQLRLSLRKMLTISSRYLFELDKVPQSWGKNGKLLLLEMEMKSESAFACLFTAFFPAAERFLSRFFPRSLDEKIDAQNQFLKQRTTWQQLHEMIEGAIKSIEALL